VGEKRKFIKCPWGDKTRRVSLTSYKKETKKRKSEAVHVMSKTGLKEKEKAGA